MAGFTCCWKVILIWWVADIPFVASPSLPGEHLLKDIVTVIPRNEREFMEQTKDKCAHSEGRKLHPTFVVNPFHNETRIGCFYEKNVTVKKCLEYNILINGRVIMQPSNYAPCGDFNLTPCNDYSSTKSYELFQCFEKYGRILSPKEKQMRIEHLERESNQTKSIKETDYLTNKTNGIVCQQENADLHSYNDIVVYIGIAFVSFFILFTWFILVIFIIPFCIQMYQNKVKCRDFWKFCFRTLKSLVSSWTTDVIQDSLSGQVSNTDEQGKQTYLSNTDVSSNQHEQGPQTYQSTDTLRTEDDTWEDTVSMRDVVETVVVEIEGNNYNEDDPLVNGTVN